MNEILTDKPTPKGPQLQSSHGMETISTPCTTARTQVDNAGARSRERAKLFAGRASREELFGVANTTPITGSTPFVICRRIHEQLITYRSTAVAPATDDYILKFDLYIRSVLNKPKQEWWRDADTRMVLPISSSAPVWTQVMELRTSMKHIRIPCHCGGR
ncbi:hypothetical protein M8J76_016142 [Diaphorina citri]|nr:hypothetical protein M8J75_013475 [Diaphorina citri]KAI5714381.1 hypothetical protein M8J76_016142 [Diaphorina citri]